MELGSVLRKVIKVINSCETIYHLDAAKKYIALYYKQYGLKYKWIVDSHIKNRKNLY
jgi:hypothetical protein